MKNTRNLIKLEILPEIGMEYGIFLQRIRLIPSNKSKNNSPILGTGVAFSRDIAKAKAISEAIERYALDKQHFPTGAIINTPIHIKNDQHNFFISGINNNTNTSEIYPLLSSSCHMTREDALQDVVSEAVEREHLIEWCMSCNDLDRIVLTELDINSKFISTVLSKLLSQQKMQFLFSWCKSPRTITTLVCIAINPTGNSFYATSSASISPIDAIEKSLLDCSKMLIMEEFSKNRGFHLNYAHPISILPQFFRKKILTKLPPLTTDFLENIGINPLIDYHGFIHTTPWIKNLSRHIISIKRQNQQEIPELFKCFQ